MRTRTYVSVGSLVAVMASTALLPGAGADEQSRNANPDGGDPDVVAARQAAANGPDIGPSLPARSPVVGPSATLPTGWSFATTNDNDGSCDGLGEACHHWALGRAWLPTLNDDVRAEIPNDWAKNDDPGWLTTTVRVWGTDWGQSEHGNKAQEIKHTDQMTCTGAGVGGLSVGSGGLSVTGGGASATGTVEQTVHDVWYHQFFYNGDAHWRCSASNFTPAKVTRRTTAQVSHKEGTTSPSAEYTFWY